MSKRMKATVLQKPMNPTGLSTPDLDILRTLAERKARIASSAVNAERRELWYSHNGLQRARPLVLAEIWGVMDESLPDTVLQCRDEWARRLERNLRSEIYEHEVVQDDNVLEPWENVNWRVEATPYVDASEVKTHVPKREDGKLGARSWEAPIKDISRDFGKIHE